MRKIDFFQKKYPQFVYQGFKIKLLKSGLKISFDFRIQTASSAICNCFAIKEPGIYFKPEILIKGVKNRQLKRVGERALNNLVFHLGLIEMLSYWKATCSPVIIIKAGPLKKEQIKWWQRVIEKGMAQFFYENKINFQRPRLKAFNPFSVKKAMVTRKSKPLKVLVPIGGGKDSIVTLELLKKADFNIKCFALNPSFFVQQIMKKGGFKNLVIIERNLDKTLLKLNQKGFLNGHTPFSAYLAFLSLLVAALFDRKYIAFSNEKSANEGNVRYLGKNVNHQWSKSFEFEKMFRDYSKKYLTKNIEYFSFLRPLYEIQVAKIFSNFPEYFPLFLSCNRAYRFQMRKSKSKSESWCSQCPKCLSIFILLSPFLEKEELLKIFGKNLLQDKKLFPLILQLIGERGKKPFECVGTKKETLVALYLGWKKGSISDLTEYFAKKVFLKYPQLQRESKRILNSWDKNNFLAKDFEKLLKNEIKRFKK